MENSRSIMRLCDLTAGQMADCFALLAARDRATTRDGKPYYRVQFRDAGRTAAAMVWSDSAWFADCDTSWQLGGFYKLRCKYSETQYGPQLELDRVRKVEDADAADGFDPADFYERSRFDADEMFDELLLIANTQITDAPLRELVVALLTEHGDAIKKFPGASRNHHAYTSGYVEHVLSVTRTAVYLADKYVDYYPQMQPPLSKSLVVGGAILHDIGKLMELSTQAHGADYTARGRLVGHILLGRDMIRDKATTIAELDPELLLRLEHIIVSHQNLPEWGSPVAPSTPEALLVYFADDIDAKFHMLARVLEEEPTDDSEFSSQSNPLRRRVFRGLRGS